MLNVIYDRANSLHGPRLQIIVEQESDLQRFLIGFNYDVTEQRTIAKKFRDIVVRRGEAHRFDTNDLFVVFSAFAPLAKEEADNSITDGEIQRLKDRIRNPDLWVISRCFGRVTFLFYTDEQAEHYEQQGKKEEYARMYFDILRTHDEFGYLSEEDFTVSFDSKQKFDEVYKSNWNYYYR